MVLFKRWRRVAAVSWILWLVIGRGLALAVEPLIIGTNFITAGVDPAKGSNGWALVSHGVGENLFTIDAEGRLVGELAESCARESEFVWTVSLKSGRLFSDGSAVTAAAIASGFDRTMAQNEIALSTGGLLRFEAVDDLTLRVTTQKPAPYLQALFAEWPMIVYKVTDEGEALFTGPYVISGFKADSHIELHANPHFDGAAERSPVIMRRFADGQAMTLAFESGELDLAFGLPSEVVGRLRQNPSLTTKSFPVGYQYLAFLNTVRPPLDDVRLRQAIDLALDREELVTALGGGSVATGAYAPYFPFAGKAPRPTDLVRAEQLLDAAGWLKGNDNMRAKDGVPLRLFAATYPRFDLITMLPVIRAQLARVGIAVETQVFESIVQMDATEEININLRTQHTAPSGDPAFVLDSMFRTGAAFNYAHYASPDFDAIIDGFATESDGEKRNIIAAQAQEKLFEDVTVSFLVSPVWYVGLSKRLEKYQPWGSDYHILRADIGEH